ncbi:MAG: proline racemase family protein [Pirellulaceae bacterium]|nr:proline racemase family protein [Pirellulaceae bacterium]
MQNVPSVAAAHAVEIVDMHTAGEPVRIVTDGFPALEGASLLEKRRLAMSEYDYLRSSLMLEPRGHADMYGAVPLPSCHTDAALSVFFIHTGGYSTMCGHASLALARWAVESGRVPIAEPLTRFLLECPCGLVTVEAMVQNDRVIATAFESVPGFVEQSGFTFNSSEFGQVRGDIAYGGAYYLIVSAETLSLSFEETSQEQLIAAARSLFYDVRQCADIVHPESPDLSFLYGVILTDASPFPEPSSNICIFGDGQVDRSPTGSGVTARLALDILKNGAPLKVSRTFYGASSDPFIGQVIRQTTFYDRPAIIARVEGRSFYTATGQILLEKDDPFRHGFLL